MKPQNWRAWPWGRTFCVIGAVAAAFGLDDDPNGAAVALVTFVAAAVVLHGLAIWKAKP